MDTKSSKVHSPPFSSSTSNRSPKRKSKNACSSPEFEFWRLTNPSLPQPNILSADQLFLDGVILPLHLISNKPEPKPDSSDQVPDSSPAITDYSTVTNISKRWKNIFCKKNNNNTEEKVKKKKEKKLGKGGCGGGNSTSSEVYINIWPFSRSKSAKNSFTRPKSFPGAPVSRKVKSAPCSRSNSAGDSKSRKFPSSPGRNGVHIGRSSPVWRHGGSQKTDKSKRETPTSHRRRLTTAAVGGGDLKTLRVLNLGCRIEESSGGKLLNLRNLFTKKTVLQV